MVLDRLTPFGAHFFFGYYDLQPWNASGTRHLFHRVSFIDRLQEPGDRAVLGYLEPSKGRIVELAETAAWNFQQGSMLQWNPASADEEIIFNVREDDAFHGCVLRLSDGSRRLLERPVATVSPTGRSALSVSFSRMFDFRPGYGYAGIPDASADRPHPSDEGVFLVDLASGRSRLVLSLERLWEATRAGADPGDHKVLVNHITWNTDGTRFALLLRYRLESGSRQGGAWKTAIVTAGADGGDLRILLPFSYASHYHWRDPETLVFHSEGPEGRQLYEIHAPEARYRVLDRGFFVRDGHCSYSPDSRRGRMLYDSYPDDEGYRNLWIYDLEARSGRALARFWSPPAITGDFRCDLHPRWNRRGDAITLDSVHEGFRAIYRIDLSRSLDTGA